MPREPSSTAALSSAAGKGRLWVALAALLWSSSGLFAKAPLFEAWEPGVRGPLLAFWRALFAGLLLLVAVRRPRWSIKLVPAAVCFAVMNVAYLSAMTLSTAANAIWLQSTAPWWVFLFGTFVLGEKVIRADLVPLVLAGAGLAVILFHEIQGQAQSGTALGLVSGMAFAGVVLALRSLREEDPAWLVAVLLLLTAAIMLPVVVYLDVWPSATQLPVLAAFGLIQMAIPYLLFAHGLKTVSSQEATGIGLIEPVLLPVWVYLAWHEQPAWWTAVGAVLILAGLVLRYVVPPVRPAASGEPAE